MSDIETRIQHALKTKDRVVFYPEQFIKPGFDLLSVLVELKSLAGQGKVELEVSVYCDVNHKLWSGPPEKLTAYPLACEECGNDSMDIGENTTRLSVRVSDRWLRELNQVVPDIEAKIRLDYLSRRTRVLWPENFLNEGMSRRDVLKCFDDLAAKNKLKLLASFANSEGRIVWSGPPDKFGASEHCPENWTMDDFHMHVRWHAEISSEWCRELDESLK